MSTGGPRPDSPRRSEERRQTELLDMEVEHGEAVGRAERKATAAGKDAVHEIGRDERKHRADRER